MVSIRPLTPADQAWVSTFLTEQAGSSRMVSRGKLLDAVALPGFVGLLAGERQGLLTYHLANNEFEVFTLHTAVHNKGLGSALLKRAVDQANRLRCRRLWLITTNDNTQALRFYQKQGMLIAAVYINALEQSRQLKPQIPHIGNDNIPIRDEIELEIRFA